MKSIFETAREDERLSTSVAMLQAGGMAETLREEGEYTALFPTNDAYPVSPGRLWTLLWPTGSGLQP